MLNVEKLDLCFLQETNIYGFSDSIANSFLGDGVTDWTTSNYIRASGGTEILWKKGTLKVNFSFIRTGFVGINII